MMEIVRGQLLNEQQFKQAEQIFAFDIFISNADRRIDKPNFLTDGEKILIFDHELAFGFVWDIIKNPTPWIISKNELGWIKNHYFYSILKGNKHNFNDFIDKFDVLDSFFWEKLYNTIPKDWMDNHLDEIKNNLTSLILHKEEFKDQLNKILS